MDMFPEEDLISMVSTANKISPSSEHSKPFLSPKRKKFEFHFDESNAHAILGENELLPDEITALTQQEEEKKRPKQKPAEADKKKSWSDFKRKRNEEENAEPGEELKGGWRDLGGAVIHWDDDQIVF